MNNNLLNYVKKFEGSCILNYKGLTCDDDDECGRKRDANRQNNSEYKEDKTRKAFEESQLKAKKAFEESQLKAKKAFKEAQLKAKKAFKEAQLKAKKAFEEAYEDIHQVKQRNIKELSIALFDATLTGNVVAMNSFLKSGADPNFIDNNIKTPLINAVSDNNYEAVKLLLDNGADINLQTHYGAAALLYSCGYNTKIAELLLKSGANPDLQNYIGKTRLLYAAACGNKKLVELLIKAGANPDLKDNDGNNAIDIAIKYNNIEVVELLNEYNKQRLLELLKSYVTNMDGSNERNIIRFPTAGGHDALHEMILEYLYEKKK
jgi:ankyrin repeat protein